MAIPEYVEIIEEKDRNDDNKYLIPNRSGYVFPFQVPEDHRLIVTVGDTHLMQRQDFALRFWFGTEMWNKADINIGFPHNVLNVRRHGSDFVFYDVNTNQPSQEEFDTPRPKTLIPLQPSTTIYANIHNLVNQQNSFDLFFLLESNVH